ncbi:MAG: hypothetical protein KGZ92_06205 [Firmicutes bacterium]|nr:hypothetical protein [Dethiobacter sp.]MBS3888877.1 hypothetical protein [Bacillota bacterium]MBS4054315.1 hypothetical protein [Thermaerobacter sp.]
MMIVAKELWNRRSIRVAFVVTALVFVVTATAIAVAPPNITVTLGGPEFERVDQRQQHRDENRGRLRSMARLNPSRSANALVVLNNLYLLDDVAITFQKNNLHVFYLKAVAKVPGVESIQAVGSPIEGYSYQMRPTELSFTIGGYDTGGEYFNQPLAPVQWNKIGSDIERSVSLHMEAKRAHIEEVRKRLSDPEEVHRLKEIGRYEGFRFTLADTETRLEQLQLIFPAGRPTSNLWVYGVGLTGQTDVLYDLARHSKVDLVELVPSLRKGQHVDFVPPRPTRRAR